LQLNQDQAAAFFHFEDSEIGDDEIDDAEAGDGQGAFLENLWAAILRGMFHDGHHALHSGNQVHRAAGALDHFAGDHPIRDVAAVSDFERAEDREIDMSAADLGKGIRAREKG
jgi:hypothetical protein